MTRRSDWKLKMADCGRVSSACGRSVLRQSAYHGGWGVEPFGCSYRCRARVGTVDTLAEERGSLGSVNRVSCRLGVASLIS